MSVEFYRESPGKFDSRTLNRESLSRWTGRTLRRQQGLGGPRKGYGSIFTLRIVRPRIFVSTFRNFCAKKLDGALRKSSSFFKNLLDPNSKFR